MEKNDLNKVDLLPVLQPIEQDSEKSIVGSQRESMRQESQTKDNNIKDENNLVEWPIEIKFIDRTISLIEKNASISDDIIDYFIERAKEEKDEKVLELIQEKEEQILIKEASMGNEKPKFNLQDAEEIRNRLLQCITILTEAVKKNKSYNTLIEGMEIELLNETIACLDWVFERINLEDDTLRIDEFSGLIMNCIIVKSNIAKLTSLFNVDENLAGDVSIINHIRKMPQQKQYGITFQFFEPNAFIKWAPQSMKAQLVRLLTKDGSTKRIFSPDFMTQIFRNMPENYQIKFLQKIIPLLDMNKSMMIRSLLQHGSYPSYPVQQPYPGGYPSGYTTPPLKTENQNGDFDDDNDHEFSQ